MVKEITILSGKGGTGKTTVTAALASLAGSAVLCDSDVDAPDLHLVLRPEIREEHIFQGAWVPMIDESTCSNCGICIDHCRFNAIHRENGNIPFINTYQCEGCRLCERICPEKAISSRRSRENRWFLSDTRYGAMVHASMRPGEENSGKLVTEVRKKARELALETGKRFIITDGPPGIGCPVIASLTGTSAVLMVTEPTLSGASDLSRLTKLVKESGIPMYAVINKCNINPEVAIQIEDYLERESIPLLAKIPFSLEITKAMIEGKTIIEHHSNVPLKEYFQSIWNTLKFINHETN